MSVYTEEEAKTKWCPFARASAADGPCEGNHSANRNSYGDISNAAHCIASACMAWQWFDELDDEGMVRKYEVKTRHYSRSVQAATEERRGYCGLAGKP